MNLEKFFTPYNSYTLLTTAIIAHKDAISKSVNDGDAQISLIENSTKEERVKGALDVSRVLVLAPHPDDEVFGCGAAVSQLVAAQVNVRIFVLTDGLGGLPESAAANVRKRESVQASHSLGYPKPTFLAREDGGLMQDEALLNVILTELGDYQPDLLIIPSIWEMHRDHRAASQVGLSLMAQLECVDAVAMYEVGVPLIPNCFIDISDSVTKKARAMRCFESQNIQQSYAEQIQGLNRYRSYTLGLQVKAAEAYHLVCRSELADFVEKHQVDINNHALLQAEKHLNELKSQLNQQNQEITPLREKNISLVAEKDALIQLNAEQEEQHFADNELLQKTQNELAETEHQLALLRNTLSWRLTAPLRWIRRYI